MLTHRLRHRIHFQHKLPDTVNADGLRTAGGWATVVLDDGTSLDAVPAEVLTGPGREWIAAGATQSEVSARINCRWFPASERDMSAWRILWDGRVYNVTSVESDITARREWRLRVVDTGTQGL